jgi:addiction module HigA family antidote
MTVSKQALAFAPDYAVSPGRLLEEYLRERNMSARELARRCGRSAKLITEILLGKAPVEPATALQLERVLDVDASIWLGFETEYRLRLARLEEDEQLSEHVDWAKLFPFKSLAERGFVSVASTGVERVRAILRFFSTGSVDACKARCRELVDVDYRTSPTFVSSFEPLAAWLRAGEIKATQIDTHPFDRARFLTALREIKQLTRYSIEDAFPQAVGLCAEAGVAFVVELPFEKVTVSGVSWWLSPKKAVIQQSGRFKRNDQFWFTFFHEAAHILLHSRKFVFIDLNRSKGNVSQDLEDEANDWAADFLIPRAALLDFLGRFRRTPGEVIEFASSLGVAPGVVVGQLQHRGILGFHQMNGLRAGYDPGSVARAASV